jgi:hypothetical protein
MTVSRRVLVAAGVGLGSLVVAALVGFGAALLAVRRGVHVSGFEVRANALVPSLAGVRVEQLRAERPGIVVELPRATVSGWPGHWVVDAPSVEVERTAARDDEAAPAPETSRGGALRLTAERVEVRERRSDADGDAIVRVTALAFARDEDRGIEVHAAEAAAARGAWSIVVGRPVASRSALRAWTFHAAEVRIGPRDDADAAPPAPEAPAARASAAGSTNAVPHDDADRVSDLLAMLFVSGRDRLERAFARLPRVEATVDRVLVDGGPIAPRLRLSGAAASFVRDEAGARARVELSTDRSPAPLVLAARADAESLQVRIEAHGGPLELEGASNAGIAVDGESTFDARARRFEARGALRIRGVQLQRRWLGATPFTVDAGLAGHAVLDPDGAFRLEDGAFDFGAARALRGRVSAKGNLRTLRIEADASLDSVDCNAAVASLPAPVRATVGQLRFEGKKGLSAHLEASVGAPDDTRLVVRENGSCTAVAAPKDLSPQAFDGTFVMPVTGADGQVRLETFGPGTDAWRPLARISRAFLAAVLTTEDAGFFQHGGVAWYAIRSALVDDLRARRFVRGGSTITMQLAKNLFLNRDKNLARKLEEVLLTDYLEDAFGKERILELYANVVELGPDVFGVEAAARHYFGVGAESLGVLEGMWLATLLPNPKERGHARRDGTLSEGKIKELRFLARKARSHGFLTDDDVADAEAGEVTLPRRDGVDVRVPGFGLEAPRKNARPEVIEGP